METPSVVDILLLPAIIAFLGLGQYLLCRYQGQQQGKPVKARWAGVALLGLSLFVGLGTLWKVLDPNLGPFYRASLIGLGRKMILVHYVAAIGPLLCLGGVVAAEFLQKRAASQYDDL